VRISKECDALHLTLEKERAKAEESLRVHLKEQRQRLIDWGVRHNKSSSEDGRNVFKEKINDIMGDWEEANHQFREIRLEAQTSLSGKMSEAFMSSFQSPDPKPEDQRTLMEQAKAWYKSGRNFVIKVVHSGFKEVRPERLGDVNGWTTEVDQFLTQHLTDPTHQFAEYHCPLERMISEFRTAYVEKLEDLRRLCKADFSPEEEKLATTWYPKLASDIAAIARGT